MTTLLLVRHGQTVWHEGNRYAGSSDVPLTDVGHEQAQALARWAADDLRSLNAHVEMLLREALKRSGRLPRDAGPLPRRGRPVKED